jgi:hypothetical protein
VAARAGTARDERTSADAGVSDAGRPGRNGEVRPVRRRPDLSLRPDRDPARLVRAGHAARDKRRSPEISSFGNAAYSDNVGGPGTRPATSSRIRYTASQAVM